MGTSRDKAYQSLLKAEKSRQWSLQISDSVRYAVLLGSLAAPLISNLVEVGQNVGMVNQAYFLFLRWHSYSGKSLLDTPLQLKKLQSKFDSVSRLFTQGNSKFSSPISIWSCCLLESEQC